MSSNQALDLLQAARAANLANLYQAQNIYYADSLCALRVRYDKEPHAQRTGQRAQAWIVAMGARNSTARALAWFLALSKAGFSGVVATNADLAEIIAGATNCKLSARTLQRSTAELTRLGFIRAYRLPTGERVETANGWKTKTVNQWRICPLAECLIRPLSHISTRTPKRRAMDRTKGNQGKTYKRFSPGLPVTRSDKNSRAPENRTIVSSLPDSDKGNESPTSAIADRRSHVAQQTVEKRPQAAASAPRGRRARLSAPRTWAALRLLFLSELDRVLRESGETAESSEILKFATAQTAENYPPLIPCPVPWTKIIFGWKSRPWAKRREILRKLIIPACGAAVASLVPIDRSREKGFMLRADRRKLEQELEARENARAWAARISERITAGDFPNRAKEYARQNAFLLDLHTNLILQGTLSHCEISADIHEIFARLADMIGETE